MNPSIESSSGGLRFTGVFTKAPETLSHVRGMGRVAIENSAIVPNIAKARPHQYPYTRRVPDYDRMRYMIPEEMVQELRNPSIIVAEPLVFAEPQPLRPRKVDRANISAIVDYDWEVWRDGVRLSMYYHHRMKVDNDNLAIWPPSLPKLNPANQPETYSTVGSVNQDTIDEAFLMGATGGRAEAECLQYGQL